MSVEGLSTATLQPGAQHRPCEASGTGDRRGRAGITGSKALLQLQQITTNVAGPTVRAGGAGARGSGSATGEVVTLPLQPSEAACTPGSRPPDPTRLPLSAPFFCSPLSPDSPVFPSSTSGDSGDTVRPLGASRINFLSESRLTGSLPSPLQCDLGWHEGTFGD